MTAGKKTTHHSPFEELEALAKLPHKKHDYAIHIAGVALSCLRELSERIDSLEKRKPAAR